MKKFTLSALCFLAVLLTQAQEEGKFRVGLNTGTAIPAGGIGFLLDVEPKYNLNDHMNVGLRLGIAVVAKNLVTTDGNEFESASFSVSSMYFGTYDYYFRLGGSFTPYVGGGVGLINNAATDFNEGDDVENGEYDATTGIGGVIRGGFEVGKFRLTIEYDLIPKTNLDNVNGEKVGTITNSFLGIQAGFFIGGGRWG